MALSLKWLRHFPFPFHLFFHFWMPYPAFIHDVGKWHQPHNLFWICISCCKNMNRTITCFMASRLLSTSPQWQGWKEGIGWRVWALQKHRLGHNWRSWNEIYKTKQKKHENQCICQNHTWPKLTQWQRVTDQGHDFLTYSQPGGWRFWHFVWTAFPTYKRRNLSNCTFLSLGYLIIIFTHPHYKAIDISAPQSGQEP